MNYYGQLPWLLWFAWFYSWYLVIKRFIFNCKVRSIKEKTSQRKAGKSSSVFKLWRVFQEVCFEQLTSYADLTQTHLHSVGDSAVSKTEKTLSARLLRDSRDSDKGQRVLGMINCRLHGALLFPLRDRLGGLCLQPTRPGILWPPETLSFQSAFSFSGLCLPTPFQRPPSVSCILETQLLSHTALLSTLPFSFCISPQRPYSLPRGQPPLLSC